MPTVTVLLFASYADALGRDRMALALPAGATAGDALARLTAMAVPGTIPGVPLLAVNACYAAADHVLAAGDEVAVIPPVAGG